MILTKTKYDDKETKHGLPGEVFVLIKTKTKKFPVNVNLSQL